jgi:exosortase
MNEHQNDNQPWNFWLDTKDCWRRLPNKVFFFLLLAVWLALFQFLGNSILSYTHSPSLFAWLDYIYTVGGDDNDSGYCKAIPFLVVGIFWWKRKELLAQPLGLWWPALVLLLVALALHFLGYVLQQPIFSIIALFVGIYALMGLAWGRKWLRHSVYPFFLFVFAIPVATHLDFILFPLRLFVCWLVEIVTHLVGIDVIRRGTQLIDPSGTYAYDVAAACSGMRSLIAVFLLATVIAFALLRKPGKRICLITLAVPFAVLGNMLRLLAIVVAAELGGQSWGDYVHKGGPFGLISLLPYVPGMIGLLWSGYWLEKHEAPDETNSVKSA